MGLSIKVCTRMGAKVASENTYGLMVVAMKEILSLTCFKVMEFMYGLMEEMYNSLFIFSIKENGF